MAGRRRSAYKRLVQTARATVRQVEKVLVALQAQETTAGERLVETMQLFLPRLKQVLDQTVRRVFEASRCLPQRSWQASLRRTATSFAVARPRKSAEFGHKVWLGEVEGGFIAQYRFSTAIPADKQQWQPTLERHIEQFGHPPWQASGDRGVHSADNETVVAEKLGVKRVVLPKPGYKSKEATRA
jgi:transposase, IS5 family